MDASLQRSMSIRHCVPRWCTLSVYKNQVIWASRPNDAEPSIEATLRFAPHCLIIFVSLFKSRSSQLMLLQTAATCSSACALGRGRRGGLRLLALRGVQGFLGSSAYASGASSSVFCSAVSNSALKRTRILRAAYLVR